MSVLEKKQYHLKPFNITELSIELGLGVGHGLTMVQLSDLHAGIYTSPELLEKAFQVASSFSPDVVLYTGDFIHTGRVDVKQLLYKTLGAKASKYRHFKRLARFYAKDLAELVDSLNPPLGSFAVWGNHDYLEGVRTIKRYLSSKIKFLVNEAVELLGPSIPLSISGLDDYRYGKISIEKAVDSLGGLEIGREGFNILLNHNPDALFLESKDLLSNFNLILCGHTHGGQICLPGSIPLTTQTKNRKFASGYGKLFDLTHVYTSKGVGCGGLPFRVFCDPEIVILRIK